MKKVPNLFERDWNGNRSRVLPVLNTRADVAWVLAGQGTPTVKWDGSAVLVRDGKLFVRYDAKRGKTPPPGFEPCQEADPETGHRPGWIPAEGNPAAKWHLDAFTNSLLNSSTPLRDGTYEAVGPQLQSNPYEFPRNILIRHGRDLVYWPDSTRRCEPPYTSAAEAFDLLRVFLETYWHRHDEMPRARLIEGIVFHHSDGRMVKVLASDLGLAWKAKTRAP